MTLAPELHIRWFLQCLPHRWTLVTSHDADRHIRPTVCPHVSLCSPVASFGGHSFARVFKAEGRMWSGRVMAHPMRTSREVRGAMWFLPQDWKEIAPWLLLERPCEGGGGQT